jgi:uncharacterized OsmC-like protein
MQDSGLVNGVDVGVLRETMNAIRTDPDLAKCTFRASNQWVGGTHNRTTVDGFYGAKQEMTHKQRFQMDADEPPILSGGDTGANPVEHLLNALASCVTTSMIMHAAANGIRVEDLESRVEGDLDLRGVLGLSPETPRGYTNIRMRFRAKAAPEDLEKLKGFASYSPVLNTITKGAKVDVEVEGK